MTLAQRVIDKIDLRCPIGPRKLLGRTLADGRKPTYVGGFVELACRECQRTVRDEVGRRPKQVLHLFDISGECIETEILW